MDTDEARRAIAMFDRGRLQTGRELRSLSQVELAREAGDLTPAAISQFEKGHTKPSAATLNRLADVLKLSPSFFSAHAGSTSESPDAFFRSLRSTSPVDRRRARALAWLVHELTIALEEHVRLPGRNLPPRSRSVDRDEVEAAAASARVHFGLPNGPVADVARTLEQHGIVTARFRVGAQKVDAFSIPYPDRPVVVLGADKGHRDRSRFDAAHELGHLVLHTPEEAGTKDAETQAHQFAAAFLMPVDDIVDELPSRPDWNQLLALKVKWQVSLAALLKRAKTLGVMNEDVYTQAMKTMSARRWRTQEPGNLGAPENPILLARALSVAAANGVTLEDIAGRRGLPIEEIRVMLAPSLDPRPNVII